MQTSSGVLCTASHAHIIPLLQEDQIGFPVVLSFVQWFLQLADIPLPGEEASVTGPHNWENYCTPHHLGKTSFIEYFS